LFRLPSEIHTHEFKGVTVYVDGHLHLFSGISSASPNVPGHTHDIAGQTSVSLDHLHGFSFVSQGPTYVDRELYKHYHYFQGITGYTFAHKHPLSGTTFVLGE
jgi:hypothetical protein